MRNAWTTRGAGVALLLAVLSGCAVQGARQDSPDGNEHLRQGVEYESQGQWAQAMEEYSRAAQTDPRGNFYLGNLLFQQSKLEEAEQAYRTALRTVGSDPTLLNNLAWLLYTRRDKLAEAEELAALAVKIAGTEHFVAYWDTLDQIRQLRDELEKKPADAPQE